MAEQNFKVKMRVGVHEFEAEGSEQFVQAQREGFDALVKAAGLTAIPITPRTQQSEQNQSADSLDADKRLYGPLFRVNQGVLTLFGKLPGADREKDAIALLLFGYHTVLDKTTVTGADLTASMNYSGYPTQRVDRMMGSYLTDGTIIAGGKQRRGRFYNLSNPGMTKGRHAADEALKLIS